MTMRQGRWILVVVGGLVPSCYASFRDLADGSADATRDSLPDTSPDVPPDADTDAAPADGGDVPAEDSRTDAYYDAPPTCEFFECGIVWEVGGGSYYDAERIYAAGAGPIMHMIAVYEPASSGYATMILRAREFIRAVCFWPRASSIICHVANASALPNLDLTRTNSLAARLSRVSAMVVSRRSRSVDTRVSRALAAISR